MHQSLYWFQQGKIVTLDFGQSTHEWKDMDIQNLSELKDRGLHGMINNFTFKLKNHRLMVISQYDDNFLIHLGSMEF